MAVFVPRNWKDLPDLSTPIDAANLNRIEAGIVAAYIQGTGTLVNADLAAGAAVGIAKLAGYPTDATKFLRGDGTWAAPTSGYVQVADSTLGVAAASFDFTGLPTTYAHLMIQCYLRGDTAATNVIGDMRFNNDSTAANYEWTENRVDGVTAAYADTAPGVNGFVRCARAPAATATASYWGIATIWITAYAGTTGFKQFASVTRGRSSSAANAGWLYGYGGSWLSASAINRVTILPEAGNWIAGSRVSIYAMGS